MITLKSVAPQILPDEDLETALGWLLSLGNQEIREIFLESVISYCEKLPAFLLQPSPEKYLEMHIPDPDRQGACLFEIVCLDAKSSYVQRISDPRTVEHRQNFLIFCLVMNLRELFADELWYGGRIMEFSAQTELGHQIAFRVGPDIQSDLQALFQEAKWTEGFLFQAAKSNNRVAENICRTLHIRPTAPGRRTAREDERELQTYLEEEDVERSGRSNHMGSFFTGVFDELRRRLKRGALWRDDLWWPKELPKKAPK